MNFKNIKVLIVDDEVLIAEEYKYLLLDYGFGNVSTIYTFDDGYNLLSNEHFDVVLLDINLKDPKGRTGIELATLIRKISNVPIVFVSAFSDVKTMTEGLKILGTGYVVKPVSSANLYAAIASILNNQSHKDLINSHVVKEETDEICIIKNRNSLIRIYWKDVFCLEVVKNYVKFRTIKYPSGLVQRGTLASIMNNMMPQSQFKNYIRINRSQIIRKDIIEKISDNIIETKLGNFKLSADVNLKNIFNES